MSYPARTGRTAHRGERARDGHDHHRARAPAPPREIPADGAAWPGNSCELIHAPGAACARRWPHVCVGRWASHPPLPARRVPLPPALAHHQSPPGGRSRPARRVLHLACADNPAPVPLPRRPAGTTRRRGGRRSDGPSTCGLPPTTAGSRAMCMTPSLILPPLSEHGHWTIGVVDPGLKRAGGAVTRRPGCRGHTPGPAARSGRPRRRGRRRSSPRPGPGRRW